MTVAHILILLATGAGVGFAGGLLGVGGSFIMTPVQYLVFTDMGIPVDIAVKLAFGTSLMVILPTAASGAWRHHGEGAVWWRAAVIMGVCGSACAFGGATLASYLPGAGLKLAFGIVVIAAGAGMLVRRPVKAVEQPKSNPWLWVAWAAPIGVISGLVGLGGGVLAVPVMVLALKFRIHSAIATSLAFVMFTSIGGVIGYIVNGQGVAGLPLHCLGYVHLEAWGLLAATSIGMAQLGARATHRLPANRLRYAFVAVMFYLGLRMLGVFG
ncbi:MAG: sulfite exporter TauE/SafE family protein [Dehalococcoidales bacterium]|nr:sulfite exporter TauE/SafE family protein [Dehalococcoidales bacterium]